MDFNDGPIDVFVTTRVVYVVTLPLTCVFKFYPCLVATLALSMQIFVLILSLSRKSWEMLRHPCNFYVSILCCEFVATILTSILLE